MKKLINKAKGWYLGLPWWGKLIGWVVFIGVIILLLVMLFMPPSAKPILKMLGEIDDLNESHHDDKMSGLKDEEKELKDAIIAKKKEIAIKVNQADATGKETMDRRDKINNATTMEELEKLQEEFGL